MKKSIASEILLMKKLIMGEEPTDVAGVTFKKNGKIIQNKDPSQLLNSYNNSTIDY